MGWQGTTWARGCWGSRRAAPASPELRQGQACGGASWAGSVSQSGLPSQPPLGSRVAHCTERGELTALHLPLLQNGAEQMSLTWEEMERKESWQGAGDRCEGTCTQQARVSASSWTVASFILAASAVKLASWMAGHHHGELWPWPAHRCVSNSVTEFAGPGDVPGERHLHLLPGTPSTFPSKMLASIQSH